MKRMHLVFLVLLVAVLSGIFAWGQWKMKAVDEIISSTQSFTEVKVEKINVNAEVQKILTEKYKLLQDEVLLTLSTCETGSVEEQDAAIILDSNGRMSLGRYQWQRESVQHYYKVLYGEDISRVEAIEIAVDRERATELTRDVLFGEDKGWANWLNCSNRTGIAKQIELINKLR